jgi:hypothetical protein
MLQALAYHPDHKFLFANEISKIREGLSMYNFEKVDRKLILKCVYHYLDVPFIDGKEQMILERKDSLQDIMNEVAVDVTKAAEFLYTKCGVIDCKLIPYAYQFVMIALFFKNNRTPNPIQLKQLVKWFFYTTYSGYFTNTSLSVIRDDIHRFRAYSLGEETDPMDYVETDLNRALPDTIQLSGVRSCALAALSILRQYEKVPLNSVLTVYVLPNTGEKTWGNTFFLSGKNVAEELYAYLTGDSPWNEDYERFALSEDLLALFRRQEVSEFIKKRQTLLQRIESQFIKDVVL